MINNFDINQARELTIMTYVEITRLGWRDKWTPKAERDIRKLWGDAWDKCENDQLRRNMFENMLITMRTIFQ